MKMWEEQNREGGRREVLIKRSGNRAGPIRPFCKGYTHVYAFIVRASTIYACSAMCTYNNTNNHNYMKITVPGPSGPSAKGTQGAHTNTQFKHTNTKL